MPELPEVEVVRRGLERWVIGRPIARVDVLHPRSARRGEGLAARLAGRAFESAERRGKFLWLPLDGDDEALVAHLGMSGQLLVQDPGLPDEAHLRIRIAFGDGGRELRFVDQRMFGGLHVDPLLRGRPEGVAPVPVAVAHIARDPLDPDFDERAFAGAVRRRHSGIKRLLLDQGLVSGIGNIYADETLWRSRLHGDTPGDRLTRARVGELLGHARSVMLDALAQGGTSFDSLYVNVNGESGYFSRSLDAYGRQGQPCRRCGRAIVREPFANRSSYRCPRCQRRPRAA